MALNVTFYEVEKRRNSTKQPSGSEPSITRECVLLDPSDTLSPNIRIDQKNIAQLIRCNYAYIDTFGRYYWVTSWNFEGPFMTAALAVDVLASWRPQIGASTQFVNRSSAVSDGSLSDKFYPMKADVSRNVRVLTVPWATTPSEGRYILGVLGQAVGTGVGPVTYFSLTQAQFLDFCREMFTTTDWTNVDFTKASKIYNDTVSAIAGTTTAIDTTAYAQEIFKAQFNPLQYIVSCMWIPFVPDGLDVTQIPYGWWALPCSARLIAPTAGNPTTFFSVEVPKHPNAATRGQFLNMPPYTSYQLSIPQFGTIVLDNASLLNTTALRLYVSMDDVTGDAYLRINDDSGSEITRVTGKMGVNVPLAKMVMDYVGNPGAVGAKLAANTIGMLGEGLANMSLGALSIGGNINNFGANVANVASTVSDVSTAMMAKVDVSGTAGTFTIYKQPAVMIAEFMSVNIEDNPRFGRPYLAPKRIDEIPGFVSCLAPTVNWKCYYNERLQIEEYLTGGIYYE